MLFEMAASASNESVKVGGHRKLNTSYCEGGSKMGCDKAGSTGHFFKLSEVGISLPETAQSILRDARMVDEDDASCRLIRVYRPLPLHFHRCSTENVLILHGRAIFQLEAEVREISEGMFVHFPKNAVHGILEIRDHPLLILTIDAPCRPDDDVTFINPADQENQNINGQN
jgi:mannose-6-phosphate isomerase-like protein (cupin superfamily)